MTVILKQSRNTINKIMVLFHAAFRWLTIYMGKPIGPQFGQMVRKMLDW